jgi:hypothetical protein
MTIVTKFSRVLKEVLQCSKAWIQEVDELKPKDQQNTIIH